MAYSDEQKAIALAALEANRGDIRKTAKFMKMPEMTIRRWSKGQNVPDYVLMNVSEKKEALSDKLERLANKLADACFEKIEDAGLQAITTSMAIAIDKMQLLREKPTSITGQYETQEAKRRRLTELLAKVRAEPQPIAIPQNEGDITDAGTMPVN